MIIFKTVKWKNLLSSGNNFTELKLDEHATTLILGENGSGKSTLLDAMCFGLYGRGFRNLKKELLVNSVNQSGLLVEINFSIGKREYKVIRGVKPNKFEIYVDNVFVNQDATVRDYQEHLEKNILKMSHRSFTQVAILGSANFVPFMQLKAKDRRNLVEDLLDISIFSTMMDLLRKRQSSHTIEVRETVHEINIMEERISGLTSQLNALHENREQKIGKFETTIKETDDNIEVLLSKVDAKNKLIKEKTSSISDRDPQEDRLKQAKNLFSKLEDKKHLVIKEIDFYQDNDNCPTCKQDLDEEHKKTHLAEKQKKAIELADALDQINGTIQDSTNRMEEIGRVQEGITSLQSQISVLQTEIISNQKYISKLNHEIKDLKTETSYTNTAQNQIDANEESLEILHKKKESLVEQGHYYDIANTLLRDQGVKQKIIKQYVPIMNNMINKYLAALEFFVGFELDESFEETIKSRFRDVFKYDNFSQGEKMRIDLALLFTWRTIARMKNSVNTNLLILDEVFDSSLDVAGTDDFLKLLNTLTEKTNTFIISHKGEALYDKFNNVIRMEKHKNFSRIAEQ
jgi:DNA repair exonuclease SbcCD ATPase subunit